MKSEKRPSVHFDHLRSGLLIGVVLTMTACVSSRRVEDSDASRAKIVRLEKKLRKANSEIETLREKNWVLKRRVRILRENEGEDPQVSEKLAAFQSGVQLDVPTRPKTPARRESVSYQPSTFQAVGARVKVLPQKNSQKNNLQQNSGEQADRVLARTVDELLRADNSAEAERTAALLEKSYPDSPFAAEARFQLGLYNFRRGNLPDADAHFQATLKSPNAHVRARAGAALMRGVIARQAATRVTNVKVARSNLELSRQSFEYVRKQFPGSPEAKRASRELRAVVAMAARVK